MKKSLLLSALIAVGTLSAKAQVTEINNNNSLEVLVPLSNGKTILYSDIDSSIWATDGTPGGTIQISSTIKYGDNFGILNGKFIFNGITTTAGTELYTSDGTAGGTTLIKDINPGAVSSTPGSMVVLKGYLYFSAATANEGRELWRSDGTLAGTTLVKDIVSGPASSNSIDSFNLFSNGTFLLFAAEATGAGVELWKSDGSAAGTVLLKDINLAGGGLDSSNPREFSVLNSTILFLANDGVHGEELWKTDGTSGGTVLVKDINPGIASSTGFEIIPGLMYPLFTGFHVFNNHAFFNAYDGTSTGEIWTTDGTAGNTTLLKNIIQGTSFSNIFIIDAINLTSSFIFPVSDGMSRSELWQSDGTPAGTVLFKAFTPTGTNNTVPFIFLPYNINFINGTYTQPLFQGNKFFFGASTAAAGYELWVSDGTSGGTSMVKDIRPGTGDGIDISNNLSYLYTSSALYFAANNGITGNELWVTDGTAANTSIVYDINPNAADADPQLTYVCNGKIIFTATDGNSPTATDLFVVNGTFNALPVKLTDFTVTPKGNDAILQWSTQQEINSKSFTVQRSDDGQHFENIGSVDANGTTYSISRYSFIDPGIIASGKTVVYYRLQAIDIDDKSALTNIISLRMTATSQWNIRLLSNPVQDNVSILVNGVTGKLQLSIRDISGRIIYTKTMENTNGEVTLPVTLHSGIYLLESENNNERKVIKFIK